MVISNVQIVSTLTTVLTMTAVLTMSHVAIDIQWQSCWDWQSCWHCHCLSAMVFVYDYHPHSFTLMEHHFGTAHVMGPGSSITAAIDSRYPNTFPYGSHENSARGFDKSKSVLLIIYHCNGSSGWILSRFWLVYFLWALGTNILLNAHFVEQRSCIFIKCIVMCCVGFCDVKMRKMGILILEPILYNLQEYIVTSISHCSWQHWWSDAAATATPDAAAGTAGGEPYMGVRCAAKFRPAYDPRPQSGMSRHGSDQDPSHWQVQARSTCVVFYGRCL